MSVPIEIKKLNSFHCKINKIDYFIPNEHDFSFFLWIPISIYLFVNINDLEQKALIIFLILIFMSFYLFLFNIKKYILSKKRYKMFLEDHDFIENELIIEKYSGKKLDHEKNHNSYLKNKKLIKMTIYKLNEFEKIKKINKDKN